jgi:nucleotide-binding universal stress UspA family protein
LKTLAYANTPEKARDILRWAKALGEHIPMEITIQTLAGAGAVEREAARLLDEGLPPAAGSRTVVVKAVSGSPEEAIAAQAIEGNYSLAMVAPAGRTGFIRLYYGSMIANVVRRVSTSVLVVRPSGAAPGGPTVPPRRVLVCVSGSRHSLTNVTVASHIAGLFKAELSILTVLSQVGLGMEGVDPWEGDPETFLKSDHALAAHLRVANELARGVGVNAQLRVRQGLVVEEIVAEATETRQDLLVIGTHRAEDFDTVYEDLTDEVVKSSPVSTLVVGLRAALF